MNKFKLYAPFDIHPMQKKAVSELLAGIKQGEMFQTLLGVTGSGKTFTVAKLVEELQMPTLVITHNKTLAAQLYSEFMSFFPDNGIGYFVSYYDYYQPEAYLPKRDIYIEKEAEVNEKIDRLRHEATHFLSTRRDVLIVASVSGIYGLGAPTAYRKHVIFLRVSDEREKSISQEELINQLIELQYERNEFECKMGSFSVKGDTVFIYPPYMDDGIKIEYFGDDIEAIKLIDKLRKKVKATYTTLTIYPAGHYVTDELRREAALKSIEKELKQRLKELKKQGKDLEAQRLKQRTEYDMELIKELGYCQGIENYSRHLDGRAKGLPPYTLLDYYPNEFLLIIDESHVTIPQLKGMSKGDRSRKKNLIEYGFRLPSAYDNRPLTFSEFKSKLSYVIFVSATPAELEQDLSKKRIIELIVRPTGLLDPEVVIKPVTGQVDDLFFELKKVVKRKERALVTTLTKKMAEDLTDYYLKLGLKVKYLHSEIDTVERVKILAQLRSGKFDILIGVNLLREGLDLPEVSLVAVLDADKEGFLRSTRSLIQVAGRAARNINGKVIFYADEITKSIEEAVNEMNRRRNFQIKYNKMHNITPKSIVKEQKEFIYDETSILKKLKEKKRILKNLSKEKFEILNIISKLKEEMFICAENLEFERAAELRDEIVELEKLVK